MMNATSRENREYYVVMALYHYKAEQVLLDRMGTLPEDIVERYRRGIYLNLIRRHRFFRILNARRAEKYPMLSEPI